MGRGGRNRAMGRGAQEETGALTELGQDGNTGEGNRIDKVPEQGRAITLESYWLHKGGTKDNLAQTQRMHEHN